METLKALHTRNSASRLIEPAPSKKEMELVYQAAFRAPDHAWLRPWRFIQVTGESRSKLSDIFLETAQRLKGDISADLEAKYKSASYRAPMVIILISEIKNHPKVPSIEQILSVGAATQNMLLALHDLGYGAIWRTGSMAFNETITSVLKLGENTEVIGYLYVGSKQDELKKLPNLASEDFVSYWE
tara:strand:- start:22888 stop:23445 length:558 start_codon:yes stop_codon:yes gene_type:complete